MTRPKVYITQEVMSANYSTADEFGDPVFLSVAEVSNVPNSLHNRKLVYNMRERFKDYDPARDYIAPSGSPVITGLVFAIAREKTDTFNVLKWNARDSKYTALRINIEKDTQNVY